MTLDEILNGLHESVVHESNTGDSDASNQRERNYRAYYMEPLESDITGLRNDTSEDSDRETGHNEFVTSDVFDGVEDTKAALSETFAPHRNTIRFKEKGPKDKIPTALANQYLKSLFWEKNNGAAFIRDAAHDGCLAKDAIAKIYWKEMEEAEEIPVDQMPPEGVLMVLAQDNIEPAEDLEAEETEQGLVFTGHLTVTKDTSYPCLDLVQPENFFADHDQADSDKFLIAQDRVETTFDELMEMGVTQDQVDQLSPDENQALRDVEDISRHQNDSTYDFFQNEVITEGQNEVWLYNGHFVADIDGNGARPWYVQYAGNLIIGDDEAILSSDDMDAKEAVKKGFIKPLKRVPYHTWSPYPLSHRWSGMAIADPLYVIQEMRSKIHRSIIDYSSRTNNPRLQGDSDNIRNFNEFIENPIGGFADLEDDSKPVTPIQQPVMSPLVFQTLEMVTQERDERSPVTRLAAGRNQDAIANQNAESMIDKLGARGERRMAMVAREFAQFLKGILQELYDIAVENDEKQVELEVDGQFQQVIPKQLGKRNNLSIAISLTTQEANAEAQRLLMLHQTFKDDEVLNGMYLPNNRFQLMNEVAELLDRPDFNKFLAAPESDEYKQAQQQRQQSMQQQSEEQKKMQMLIPQLTREIETLRLQLDEKVEATKAMQKDRELDIKEATASVGNGAKLVEVDGQRLDNSAKAIGLINPQAAL